MEKKLYKNILDELKCLGSGSFKCCPLEGLARIEVNGVENYTSPHPLYFTQMRTYQGWDPSRE